MPDAGSRPQSPQPERHGGDDDFDLEELLPVACAAGRVGVWELDRRTGQVRLNGVLRDLVGLDAPHAIDGGNWLDRVHPDDQERALAATRGTDTVDVSYRILVATGDWRELLVRGSVVAGHPDRLIGIAVDATSAWRGDHELAETLEVITDAYYALDAEERFSYVNREAERLLGRPRAQLLGRKVWQEFPRDETFATAYERVAARGEPDVFEAHYDALDLWCEVRVYPLPGGGLAVYFRDIGQRRRHEAERERLLQAEQAAREQAQLAQQSLAHQATHDALTGLANRRQVADLLAEKHRDGVLLFLDIDRFKQINDSLGHGVGDALLIEAAARLRATIRPGDTVARMGGDEFVVLLPGADLPLGDTIAERILGRLRVPFEIVGHRLYVTASIGIAKMRSTYPAEEMLRAADVALYRAKDAGRDRSAQYDEGAHRQVAARLRLEGELRQAVERNEFLLHHQPAFDLATGHVQSVEALVRWQHPERGMVAPGAFIALAEDTGLIEPLGELCLSAAFATTRGWADAGQDWTGWVNVSLRQLERADFAARVLARLAHHRLRPERLGLEMTESVLSDDASRLVSELRVLSDAGVRLAIDDFGTGYSSLARLRALPFDVLKIDRSFVADVHTGAGAATVAAIIDLAHALGSRVVAEGVETPEQLAALRRMGADAASGFLLARPVPQAELAAAVAAAAPLLRS